MSCASLEHPPLLSPKTTLFQHPFTLCHVPPGAHCTLFPPLPAAPCGALMLCGNPGFPKSLGLTKARCPIIHSGVGARNRSWRREVSPETPAFAAAAGAVASVASGLVGGLQFNTLGAAGSQSDCPDKACHCIVSPLK